MAQTVTPLPAIGDVVAGQDVPGRELRISGHPESDRVVLSIWQDGRCQATVRLARADVPEVIRALATGLVPVPTPDLPERTGTIHQLRPDSLTPSNETDQADPAVAAPTTPLRQATTQLATALTTRLRKFTPFR
jgi:hypothetical protein